MTETLDQIALRVRNEIDRDHGIAMSDWLTKKYANALFAELNKQEPIAWQPIETAPKDGTNIILSNGSSVAQGWWMHVDGGIYERRDIDGNYAGQDEIDGYIGWWDVDGGMIKEPTHWMPLPALPSNA